MAALGGREADSRADRLRGERTSHNSPRSMTKTILRRTGEAEYLP
jgi:hypothetical protein